MKLHGLDGERLRPKALFMTLQVSAKFIRQATVSKIPVSTSLWLGLNTFNGIRRSVPTINVTYQLMNIRMSLKCLY